MSDPRIIGLMHQQAEATRDLVSAQRAANLIALNALLGDATPDDLKVVNPRTGEVNPTIAANLK